jgi:hypothetical protein
MDVRLVPLFALAACVLPAAGTALVAAWKGRDGAAYFVFAFLWGCVCSAVLLVTALLGLAEVFAPSPGIGSASAALLVGGSDRAFGLVACGAIYALPVLLVFALPSRARGASRRPEDGEEPAAGESAGHDTCLIMLDLD